MDAEQEKLLVKAIYDEEFGTVKTNSEADNADFESYIDMFDMIRTEKNYDWKSDISLPEFLSHILTQISLDVDQYFRSRDFVEVYVQDEGDEAKLKSQSAKECVNRTLNQRHLHHYLKFTRGKTVNVLSGKVYARAWWEKEYKRRQVGTKIEYDELDIDINGDLMVDPEVQVAEMRPREVDVFDDVAVIDRFNYDILDPRNVFVSNEYTYSLQDKEYIYIREEKNISELKTEQKAMDYINLDDLGKPNEETKTSKESYNKLDGHEKTNVNKKYDILHRFGKFWVVVDKRDEEEEPVSISSGLDENGVPLDDAEFIECFISFAVSGKKSHLIRFIPNTYIDAMGLSFRPIFRGLCYIHPTVDGGMGDGKAAREIQIAIDDTFNVNNDRVMMSTMPTLKGKKYALEDNDTVFLAPEHVIELEDPHNDLVEMQFSDNTQGALNQMGMLFGKMDQITSIYPNTMGRAPGGSTTATAVMDASQNSTIRTNYKSLTFENTFLQELYWMILQMTNQFAEPETGYKLMGEKVYNFDASAEYFYKPVSQAIETEQSKMVKRREWREIMNSLLQIQNPNPSLFNYVLTKIFEYMGDEQANFAAYLFDPNKALQTKGGSQPAAQGEVMSNQNNVPQSMGEQNARESMNAANN